MRRAGKTILWIIFSLLIMSVSGKLVLSILNGPKNVQKYSNGDKVYIPTEDTIQYDTKNYVTYYDNLLIAYLEKELSRKEKNQLAKNVNGKLVGDITGCMNVIQIEVDHTDYTNLTKKAKKLMESKEVVYASYEFPMEMEEDEASENDKNPWEKGWISSKDNHDADENRPAGNDWWAEAIRAYTAWNYVDSDQVNLSEVSVGIVDSGVDTGHEEFQKDGKTKINFLENYKKNTPDDHGTHVTGIIAAEDNNIGLRGIADKAKIYLVDWHQNPNKADDENLGWFGRIKKYFEGNSEKDSNMLSSGKYLEITKQLVEEENIVINNSWSNIYYSQKKFKEKTNLKKGFKTYEAYQRALENDIMNESYQVMEIIDQLLLNNKEKFLIVQAAGNGYDGSGPGHDTYFANYYCSITEKNFNKLKNEGKLSSKSCKYEDIKNHIIIVGAVEIKKGSYKLRYSSNYGSIVDIVAPGENIYSTVKGNKYKTMSGTSMAAPMVSGSAALVWSVNPNLSAKEVKDILIDTAGTAYSSNKNDSREEYPMLDVGLAVQIAGKKLTEKTENSSDINDKKNVKSESDKPYFALDNQGYKLIKNIRRNEQIKIDDNQLNDVNSDFVKLSKDSKYIFYLEADESNVSKTLCRCEYEKLEQDSDENGNYCKIIAKDVQSNYIPLKDGKVVYLDSASRLYYYDGNSSILLEENKVSNLYSTDDTERIVYEYNIEGTDWSSNVNTLYGIDLKNPNEKKVIVTNYDYLYPVNDLSNIYYCKYIIEDGMLCYEQERELYVTGFNKEPKKLGYEVYGYNLYKDTMYYTVEEENVFSYQDYIIDSSGNTARLNSIKSYLRDEDLPTKLRTLYSYSKGKASIIATDIVGAIGYGNSIEYIKPDMSSKIDIANESSKEKIRSKVRALEIKNQFFVSVIDGSLIQLIGSAQERLISDASEHFSDIYVTKSSVFIDNSHYDNENFMVANIKNGKASDFETVEKKKYIQGMQGSTLYYTEGANAKNDLYAYKDGKKKCVATEFIDNTNNYGTLDIYEDSTMLSYINFNGESGTLLMLDSEGQKKVIGDNVTMYIRKDKDTILYIADGKLMSYAYGKTKKIMNNAKWIWSFSSLEKLEFSHITE